MKPLHFILITIFLDAFGLGFVIPSLPDVIRRFSQDTAFVNHYYGYFIAVYALMQFLASPVLGALSDRFGRRPILLVSLLAAGLDYILMAFAPNLTILFAGRLLSGITGASLTVANSYIGDTSDDTNRSANFGLMGAAWGVGFIAGPVIGGLLGGYAGPASPFLAAALFNLVNFFFGLFILPESLPEDKRRDVQLGHFHPFRSIRKSFRLAPRLITVYALYFLASQVYPSIWTLYTEYKFGWKTSQVGLSLAFMGGLLVFIQGGLTRVITSRMGEHRTLFYGMLSCAVAFALFAFATQGWMMYAIIGLTAFSLATGPSLQSLITKEAIPEEQGELQGSLVSIAALTEVIGPLLYTELFSAFTRKGTALMFPGSGFATASIICLMGTALLPMAKRRQVEASISSEHVQA